MIRPRKFIEHYFKLWGVMIETDLFPEFYVTKHAYSRLRERFRCSEKKTMQVILKAWASREKSTTLQRKRYLQTMKKYPHAKLRLFHGKIFVFDIRWKKGIPIPQKVLITVI